MEWLKKWKLNSRWLNIASIFVAALFLAASFYVVLGINADDASSYMWLYRWHELGAYQYTLKQKLEPWRMVLIGVDFMGLGSTGAELLSYCYAILYFFCTFITLALVMKDNRKNKWLLLCAVFMMLPSDLTNRYHLPITLISLLIIYIGYYCILAKKKRPLVLAGVLFIYSLVLSNDRVMILLFILAPILLYMFIACLQDKAKRKYLYFGGVLIVVAATGIRVADEICQNVSGHGLAIMEAWRGYGGGDYLMWIDVYNLFDKGIPSFFQTLLNQYNIPVGGGMIQYYTFFWIVRIFVVGLALAAVGARWKEIVKKGILNVNALDAFSTVCVTVVILVNVLNGIIQYFSIREAYMNRYASIVWFLLVVILMRWLDEYYVSFPLTEKYSGKFTSGVVLGIVFALLTVGYSKPMYKGRDALVREPCQSEVDYLRERGDGYGYGIASYWKTNPISAITNGEYIVLSGRIERENTAQGDVRYYLNRDVTDPVYTDGTNFFNYMISHVGDEKTINMENIEAMRGDYIDRRYTENEGSIFYRYDYDIRFDPVLIMEAVGEAYELTAPVIYHFDMPVGVNRIELEVENSGNLLLEIADNDAVGIVEKQELEPGKIYIDMQCFQNTKVTLLAARKTDAPAALRKIVLKRVFASIPIVIGGAGGSYEVYLKPGDYVMTFAGRNIDNMQVAWESQGAVINQSTDGRIRRRYQMHIDTPQTVKYTISGDGIEIERVSYENADLFYW